MSISRDVLEDHLQEYEMQLKCLKSYLKELNHMTDRHGTEREHFENDLFEAEHNIKYYEGEVARLKGEISALGKSSGTGKSRATALLPQTMEQGVGYLVLSMIGFGIGMLLGSKMNSGHGGGDASE
jgi:chromosome segregation ATPase